MMKRYDLTLPLLVLSLIGTDASRAGTLVATVLDQDNRQPLPEVVVTARSLGMPSPMPKKKLLLVDQIDKEFVNKTTLINVGDSINFPNKDNIDHHVYSFSAVKQFELPLYKDMPHQPVLFDKPGVVKLGCNIHDWMVGYIYVADTPFAAMTDAEGNVSVANLPEGDYELRVWHPRLVIAEQQTTKRITIPQGDASNRVIWEVGLKPDFRPRRAPMGIGRGY